jgi:hypothetical protein
MSSNQAPRTAAGLTPRRLSPQSSVLIAIIVALIVLAVGRWVPLPPLVTGEEGVRKDLVEMRGKVVAQRYLYLEAQREFEHYLYTVSVPPIPAQMHAIAAQIRQGTSATAPTGILQECAERVGPQATPIQQAQECARRAADFGRVLSRYAHPSDDLFALLRQYDDQLMAYSRTLGARSEELRRGTWPILSWLQRYPPPVGDRADIHFFPGSEVDRNVTDLDAAAAALANAPDPADAVERAATAADPIWDAGLMVPTIAWFHDGYYSALRRYDAQMLEVAAAPDQPLAGNRALIAGAATALLLALMFAGLVLLFLPGGIRARGSGIRRWVGLGKPQQQT